MGFRCLVYKLEPGFRVPSHTTIAGRIRRKQVKGQAKLCEHLLDVAAVGVTPDMWTLRAVEGYITVTAHFWDRFKMKSLVLATAGFVDRHIGANIGRRLVDITRDAGVCGIVSAVTHDEASA